MTDWLSGFSRPRPFRALPPSEPPAAVPPSASLAAPSGPWRKGQTRTLLEVACCPDCGSLEVKIRTPRGDRVLLVCLLCGHEWKDARCRRVAPERAP